MFFTVDNSLLNNSLYSYQLSDIIHSLIILTIILIYNVKSDKNKIHKIFLAKKDFVFSILIVFLCSIFFRIAIDPIINFNEILYKTFYVNDSSFTENVKDSNKSLLIFFNVVILIPIIEEIVFRGYILKNFFDDTVDLIALGE